jgi:Histidine kinase-, DNA gyrase B-, and HSP90-like ATPase
MDSSKQKTEKTYHTLQMKPGETELLRLRNQTNAIGALAELVWNSIDADAKNIHVDWSENEMMGVENIVIQDDGHGIASHEDDFSRHPFASLGDSDKHTVHHQSPEGRILHGRFGKGRIRALALGGVIDWETVFQQSPKSRRRYTIRAVVGEASLLLSEPKNSKKACGTKVLVSHVSEKGNTLELGSVRKRFSLIFSEHLANYSDINIFVQGEKLNPESMILKRKNLGAFTTNFEPSGSLDWDLRCVHWKESVSDSRGRLFLCDANKLVIGEHELALRGAEDYTFYLDCEQAREWEDDGLIALKDDAQQVFLEARLRAHRFLRKSFGERAQSLAEEMAEQRILPYPTVSKSPEMERQRKMFSEMALHIKQNVGSYDKMNLDNKRLLFKLLQGLLELEPKRAVDILDKSLKMSAEDRKSLMALVEAVHA